MNAFWASESPELFVVFRSSQPSKRIPRDAAPDPDLMSPLVPEIYPPPGFRDDAAPVGR